MGLTVSRSHEEREVPGVQLPGLVLVEERPGGPVHAPGHGRDRVAPELGPRERVDVRPPPLAEWEYSGYVAHRGLREPDLQGRVSFR